VRVSEHGFTLVEMAIAVAISAILVGGIYEALVSSQRTAEAQGLGAAKAAGRMRAIELLKTDLRARLKMKVETTAEGGTMIALASTADSIAMGEMKRMLEDVRYTATSKGLKRREGKSAELDLVTGAVTFQFWEKGAWRNTVVGEALALRVNFSDPEETVVIR
jgi:prepilin-type N-terminal cleavage/methylation domain-containing protein